MSNTLGQWQQAFTQSLLGELTQELASGFANSSAEARQQRFAIYQNNVFYSLTNALGDLYPVVKKLVGDDFFTGTASFYLRAHPPKHAAMVHLGHDFPEFLESFEHTHTMPYLAKVARLELARHRAYHAKDHTPLSAEDIAQYKPDELASASIRLHPSLQVVTASNPILTIWQANQTDSDPNQEIQLNEPQQVLVVRAIYDIAMYSIDLATEHFIRLIGQGQTLEQTIEATLDTFPDAAIGEIIQFMVQEQLIIAVHFTD